MGAAKNAWFDWFENNEQDLMERWLETYTDKNTTFYDVFQTWTLEQFEGEGDEDGWDEDG